MIKDRRAKYANALRIVNNHPKQRTTGFLENALTVPIGPAVTGREEQVIGRAGGIGAILVAAFGLIAYMPGFQLLGSIRGDYIPMAPSTAVGFIVLGTVALMLPRQRWTTPVLVAAVVASGLVSLFGMLEVAGYITGADLNLEDAVVPSVGLLNGVPIARMSPATGAVFFLLGLAVLMCVLERSVPEGRARQRIHGAWVAALVLLISFTFCLAYLYGAPLMYGGGTVIPMALTTALAFLLLSSAVLACQAHAQPLRTILENSTRGRLLRAFLPVATGAVVLSGVGVLFSQQGGRPNPAIVAAGLTVLIALSVGMVATWLSGRLSAGIDAAEAALKESGVQLRRLAAALQSSRETERTSVARDLHDQIGQALTSIDIDLGWLAQTLGSGDPAVTDRLSQLRALVRETVDSVRRIYWELRPPALDDLGLAEALDWEIAAFTDRTGIEARLVPGDLPPRIDATVTTVMFRVMQGALTHIARQRDSAWVRATIGTENGEFLGRVTSDGAVAQTEVSEERLATDLLGMTELAGSVGGRVVLGQRPEGGFELTVAVPLGRSEGEATR